MELNTTQLLKVREYVALGWKHPDTQIVITNHIKYRVQDIMTEGRTITVEQAVQMAHTEFGKDGFKVFEDEMKATLKNKYDKVFWASFTSQLNFKGLLVLTTAILWFYLLFTDVRLPESIGFLPWMYILVFSPQYLITLSTFLKPAKQYRKYHTLAIGNVALFRWFYLILVTYALYAVVQFTKFYDNFLLASIIYGIIFFVWVLLFRAGYAVRHASLNDCRQIDAQNLALSA